MIVVIRDPASKWMVAKSFTSSESVPEVVSGFAFHTMCTFGIVSECQLNGGPLLTADTFAQIKALLSFKLEMLDVTDCEFTYSPDGVPANIVGLTMPQSGWDESILDAWLFKKRTEGWKSAFGVMFNGRKPMPRTKKPQKDPKPPQPQKPRSKKLPSRVEKVRKINEVKEANNERPETAAAPELSHEVANDVRGLLNATQRERCKRGKYAKFSIENQRQIVEYAQVHGNCEAARVFSEKLGSKVHEASIRRFAKTLQAQPKPGPIDAKTRDAIGRYAQISGVSNAVNFFGDKLQFPINEKLVKNIRNQWIEDNGNKPISLTIDDNFEESAVMKSIKPNKSGKARNEIRGKYAFYGPTLKAEIAEFARDHTNQQTIEFFQGKYDIQLPESTIRGIKKRPTDVKRGRKMALGNYDLVVRDCVVDLIKSGEKLTSFLAIATAKQVLMKHDPSLLEEFGGSVKLNLHWAKSFLRRHKLKSL